MRSAVTAAYCALLHRYTHNADFTVAVLAAPKTLTILRPRLNPDASLEGTPPPAAPSPLSMRILRTTPSSADEPSLVASCGSPGKKVHRCPPRTPRAALVEVVEKAEESGTAISALTPSELSEVMTETAAQEPEALLSFLDVGEEWPAPSNPTTSPGYAPLRLPVDGRLGG